MHVLAQACLVVLTSSTVHSEVMARVVVPLVALASVVSGECPGGDWRRYRQPIIVNGKSAIFVHIMIYAYVMYIHE